MRIEGVRDAFHPTPFLFYQEQAIVALKAADRWLKLLEHFLSTREADDLNARQALRKNGPTLQKLRESLSSQPTRVVEVTTPDNDPGHLPATLTSSYQILCDKVYGPLATVQTGDDTAIRIRAVDSIVDSRMIPTPGPKGADHSNARAKRSIIKDHDAYALKRKIDRKLSRIAAECRGLVPTDQSSSQQCYSCKRLAPAEHRYCSSCGDRLPERQETG